MHRKTLCAEQRSGKLARAFLMAVVLVACSLLPRLAFGEPLQLEIRVNPEHAETMQTFEVTVFEEIDQEDLFAFIHDCHLRAASTSHMAWYSAAVADDDLLRCRVRDRSQVMEMDLRTTTEPDQAAGLRPQTEAEAEDAVIARFEPELGYEHRVRFLSGNGSWSEWTIGPIDRKLPISPAGQDRTHPFQNEIRPSGSRGAVAMSGYIRIKKLNSGD